MTAVETLSRAQARRIAVAAQGFGSAASRRGGVRGPSRRTVEAMARQVGILQVDSVNVLQRAHHLPLYSRLGPYDLGHLHAAASGRDERRLVEYWAHVQALMDVDLWPAMAPRRAHYRARRGKWSSVPEDVALEARLLDAIARRGASTARELDALAQSLPRTREHWGWNWSQARRMLDHLFTAGEVAIAGRTSQFEVRYDLPERVLPAHVLAAPDLAEDDAHRELVRRAARAHGVATAGCLADYHRLRVGEARPAIRDLVEAGELVEVAVEGWDRPAYLHRDARVPQRVSARALLSPFDPLVWERARVEAIFGFRYRIEIYVPAHLRVHGYYVLPFLLGDRLVARVDLKADRAAGRLLVQAAWAESDAPASTAAELADELHVMAGWLGLDRVEVVGRGDLATSLAAEVAASARVAARG